MSYKSAHCLVIWLCLFTANAGAEIFEIYPPNSESCDEEFVNVANKLKPGDELVLHDGVYLQACRRAITAKGESDKPIVIRAAEGARPLITRPPSTNTTQNNIEIVDSTYLVVRGLHFRGGSIGFRIIRGHHVTLEDNEIFETQNNALAINAGDVDSLVVRDNHIHHTGLNLSAPTEGEGIYAGCHDGKCKVTNSFFEANYIHHLRGSSEGGNDGIEIKLGSYGNVIRDNVIHDTNIGTQFPCIFVYGGGAGVNVVERNVMWNCGEGIQVVADALVQNNIILNSSIAGITAAPHQANRRVRNVTIVNNTIVGHPKCLELRWEGAENMVLANNALHCPGGVAIDALGLGAAGVTVRVNAVEGIVIGANIDGAKFFAGGRATNNFKSSDAFDVWPRARSVLIGRGDPTHAPRTDFNDRPRGSAKIDVGAYQSNGRAENPGWKIVPGFKRLDAKSR
ncbi:MAG: right-handed parallel beta-helix repeat-containing protein [Candidatus Binatia bacterium]